MDTANQPEYVDQPNDRDVGDQSIVMRLRELSARWHRESASQSRHFYESADAIEHCADELDEFLKSIENRVVIDLSVHDAKWLDVWMQDEFKREGFRPHEPRKPEVVEVGAAVQAALEAKCGEPA